MEKAPPLFATSEPPLEKEETHASRTDANADSRDAVEERTRDVFFDEAAPWMSVSTKSIRSAYLRLHEEIYDFF